MIRFQNRPLPLDQIDEPAAPLRESIDETYIGELADSIASLGLLQPIGVRGPSPAGRYEVVWGHCRLLAARTLRLDTIEARVCEWGTPPGEARAAENLHRTDLNPREEAREVARLIGDGFPVAHIARILRRSPNWVDARRELLTWPDDIQDRVASGALAMSAARLLAEIDHPAYRESLLAEVERTGASTNVVATWTAHYHADRERIIRNTETVAQIVARREEFVILFNCEVCDSQEDTRTSALLRVCTRCARTLADEKAAAKNQPAATS